MKLICVLLWTFSTSILKSEDVNVMYSTGNYSKISNREWELEICYETIILKI